VKHTECRLIVVLAVLVHVALSGGLANAQSTGLPLMPHLKSTPHARLLQVDSGPGTYLRTTPTSNDLRSFKSVILLERRRRL
jgi:hypothetical protein